MRPYRHVYLEPHFDDVALSCGGQVRLQTARGEAVLVVTLFAGDPGAGAAVTAFAAGQHARWGGHGDPIAERRAEQRAALAALGADWLPLDHFDAIYRGDQYLSDDDLFGPVKPGDAGLVEAIGAELAAAAVENPGAAWYAPLGVGNHVDHQLALRAAQAARLAPLWLYEDFPYAAQRPVEPIARALGARAASTTDIGGGLEAKIAAIGCYRSQIPTLFGDAERMVEAVRSFALARGRGRPAERYWRLRTDSAGRRVLDSKTDRPA
ncbi:MAG TPA: PIG-L family deacetylase [Chloroflexota bacterium]|nr:PIG-L family deacetylase [Chloroflexota bacterium]